MQFHSLNSAFPGQSQAFTEFSPYTPDSKKKKLTPTLPPPPIKLPFHPLFMWLQSRLRLFEGRHNSQCGAGCRQSRAETLAEVTQGHNWFHPPTQADNYNFLSSDLNCDDCPCSGKHPNNFNGQGSGGKMSLSVCWAVSDSCSVASLQIVETSSKQRQR